MGSKDLTKVPETLVGTVHAEILFKLLNLKLHKRAIDVVVSRVEVSEDFGGLILLTACEQPARRLREKEDKGDVDGGEDGLNVEWNPPGVCAGTFAERDRDSSGKDGTNIVKRVVETNNSSAVSRITDLGQIRLRTRSGPCPEASKKTTANKHRLGLCIGSDDGSDAIVCDNQFSSPNIDVRKDRAYMRRVLPNIIENRRPILSGR